MIDVCIIADIRLEGIGRLRNGFRQPVVVPRFSYYWYDIRAWRERKTRVVAAHAQRTQEGPYRPLSSALLGMAGSRRAELQASNVVIALIRPITSIGAVVRPSAMAVEGGVEWYPGTFSNPVRALGRL